MGFIEVSGSPWCDRHGVCRRCFPVVFVVQSGAGLLNAPAGTMNVPECLRMSVASRRCSQVLYGASLWALSVSFALADTVLNQWNFNGTTNATYRTPSSGTVLSGTIRGYGTSGIPSAPLSNVLVNGAASDPGTVITGTNYNRSATVNPPALDAANSSSGLIFLAPTTGMSAGEAVRISWSQTVGFRSSRFWQLLVSTSGTAGPFAAPIGGTGSSISQFVNGLNSGTSAISGTATVNVSSTGVVDFRTINGNWLSQTVTTGTDSISPSAYAAGFVDNISYTLPTGQGYENNASFAFAIAGIWDPNGTYTSGTTGLLSSFAGLDSTDTTNGYDRNLGSGGSMRIDLVTVSAVPEPSTYAMALAGLACGGYLVRRRRKRA